MAEAPPYREKPCVRFQKFFYNRTEHTVCNRNAKNWLRLFYQYILFLALVHILFLLLLYNIHFIIKKEDAAMNKLSLTEAGIPVTMTIVPIRVNDLSEPIIWFVSTGDDRPGNRRASAYVKAIDKFLKDNERECKKFPNKTCVFQRQDFGPCSSDDFGYTTFQPCLFIKLNRIEGWRPLDYSEIPSTYPKDLKKSIEKHRSTAWIYCTGESNFDTDHIGKIKYYPSQGFKDGYFPYLRKENKPKLNPVLAIQLEEIEVGLILTLKCQIYSRELEEPKETKVYIYMEQ